MAGQVSTLTSADGPLSPSHPGPSFLLSALGVDAMSAVMFSRWETVHRQKPDGPLSCLLPPHAVRQTSPSWNGVKLTGESGETGETDAVRCPACLQL